MTKNSIIFETRTTEITLDELKELDSFKDYSEQQANDLIHTMKTFARIIYSIWSKEEQNCTEDNKPTEINIANPIKKAA